MKSKDYELGKRVVGPLMERYLFKLWLLESFWKDKDATLLFVARGGLRIRYYYELFLRNRGLESQLKCGDFLISRMAAYKAALARHNDYAIEQLAEEFTWYSVEKAALCLFPKSIVDRWSNSLNPELVNWFSGQPLNADILNRILNGEYDPEGILTGYLGEQMVLLNDHMEQIAGSSKYILLVDTGWGGSIVRTVKELFPDRLIMAFFYGRYSYGGKYAGAWFNDVIGLEAEGDSFEWRKSGSAIFENRHLIEGVCEVSWPSVSGYERGRNRTVITEAGLFPESNRAPSAGEYLALGVENHLVHSDIGINASEIHRRGVKAGKQLRRIVAFPTSTEARSFCVETRSADFGKDIDVPVLYRRAKFADPGKKLSNVKNSLWPQAQIAVEFPIISPFIQLVYQLRDRLRLSKLKRYFI